MGGPTPTPRKAPVAASPVVLGYTHGSEISTRILVRRIVSSPAGSTNNNIFYFDILCRREYREDCPRAHTHTQHKRASATTARDSHCVWPVHMIPPGAPVRGTCAGSAASLYSLLGGWVGSSFTSLNGQRERAPTPPHDTVLSSDAQQVARSRRRAHEASGTVSLFVSRVHTPREARVE